MLLATGRIGCAPLWRCSDHSLRPITSPLGFTVAAPAAMLDCSAGKLTCRSGVNDQNTSNIMANKSAKSKQQKSKAKKSAAKKSAGKKK